jgi:HTH-type transcriptional regulator/antitoxin HigA
MINNKLQYNPNFVVHPGETLEETLADFNISQKDLSLRIGITEKHISNIINGKVSITPEIALKLSKVFGNSVSFWNNLQKNYDQDLVRIESNNKLETEIEVAKKYNYKELAIYKLVPIVSNWREKVSNLQTYFGVDSLFYISKVEGISFRNMKTGCDKNALSSWLRFGEIEFKKIHLAEYNESKLKEAIKELRKLTFLPKDYYKTLQSLCAECGVAIVYTPYFKNIKINGAVRWIGENPLIQLNSKGVSSDVFWFTLFHEIGHVILHGKKDKFLDFGGENNDVKEKEADKFAADLLIPSEKYTEILSKKSLSTNEAKEITNSLGIDISVLTGRFAHDKLLKWSDHNKFRKEIHIQLS